MDDQELLRAFAREGSEAAFSEIVRRYVDLVYSAALRQVRDPAAVEDVVQVVFWVLSRKAGQIKPGTVLSGWLYKAAFLASRNLLKTEGRRRRHEQAASKRETMPPTQSPWEQIEPELDRALARLGQASRVALLLRFFEGKSFKEVGQRLGITEVAARQRVFRGLEQLRSQLSGGAMLSATAVGELLAAHAVDCAPSHVGAAAAALAGKAAASAKHVSIAKGVITLMAWTKTKIAVACAAGLLLLGGAGTVGHHFISRNRDQVVVIQPMQRTGNGAFPIGAVSADGVHPNGIVVTADGKPVAGAQVVLANSQNRATIFEKSLGGFGATQTDAQGRFEIGIALKPRGDWSVAVLCEQGFAQANAADLLASQGKLTVEPWARLEGFAQAQGKPAAGFEIIAARFGYPGVKVAHGIDFDHHVHVDANGHYVVEHVPPGPVWIELLYPNLSQYRFIGVKVAPGETRQLDLGQRGRTITGRVLNASGEVRGMLVPQVPETQPKPDPGMGPLAQPYQFRIAEDGGFRVLDIPPGQYRLEILQYPRDSWIRITATGKVTVTVPPLDDQSNDQPIEAGEIRLTPYQKPSH